MIQIRFKLYPFLVLIFLTGHLLNAQNSKKGQLRLSYFPIERVQTGGPVSVDLPTHFHFLKPLDGSTRFAPDEPSSFSSLDYSFWVKEISEKLMLESTIGIYRNHFKGDFLPTGDEAVHFGKGNSQVGPQIGISIHYRIWNQWSLGTGLQTGIGPHFSDWRSNDQIYDPDGWGIRGVGWSNNLMVFMESSKWRERLFVKILLFYNVSLTSYADFSGTSSNGIRTDYSDFSFSTRSKRPNISFSIGFDLFKNK